MYIRTLNVAAKSGLYEPELRQVDLLRRLRDRGILRGDVDRLFHELRIEGSKATHGLEGNARTALSCLRYARWLGTWFHKTFTKNPTFDPGPFLPPPNPVRETEALKAELERLRQEIQQGEAAIAAAQLAAQTEAERRIAAETLAAEIEAQCQAVEAHQKQIQEDAKQQVASTNR